VTAETDSGAAVASDTQRLEQVARIYDRLVAAYGIPDWTPDGDALGGLIATVLSQHTSDVNSHRAYQRLRERFPTWEAVRDAPVAAVEEAIRSGGLAAQKAERIQEILRVLSGDAAGGPPEAALADLGVLPLGEAQARLRALPGVGPKTAACVLLFSLGRPAFPVDTHVLRVAKRLGLISSRTTAEDAHDELTAFIPPSWRHTLHVDLIHHGRHMCYAHNPACPRCPLQTECRYFWESAATGRDGRGEQAPLRALARGVTHGGDDAP
jgi:endonuclease-3